MFYLSILIWLYIKWTTIPIAEPHFFGSFVLPGFCTSSETSVVNLATLVLATFQTPQQHSFSKKYLVTNLATF